MALLISFPLAAYGQHRYQVIHYFTGRADGSHPGTGLVPSGNGGFFGTTNAGALDWGNVFELHGLRTPLLPLHDFTPRPFGPNGQNGGIDPSPLTIGSDGDLYGAAGAGGNPIWSWGTVFKMFRDAGERWIYDVLYRFGNDPDGCGPSGSVIFDQAGNIYGTTFHGGSYPYADGTVYKLAPSGGTWQESVIWSFGHGADGAEPFAGLVMDGAGNLYGTTTAGGLYNWGTVFELSPSSSGWTERVLYNFQDAADGAKPQGGLILDRSGNLYGATLWGPPNNLGGVVFELTPSGGSWTYRLLYNTDAGVPTSLTADSAGSLYGVTGGGGLYGDGTVFELTHTSGGWTYSDLHDFDEADGDLPIGSLMLDAAGNLWGTTDDGGAYPCEYDFGCGVVFKLTLQ
jgi:uncharacterized repeat protein (TIGR03803 family)